MASLQEIRKKLLEQQNRTSADRPAADNTIYPFWNLESNKDSTLRFLPDGNVNNTFFWVERAMIRLPFAGLKGDTNSKPLTVQVPCMHMYNETCPIISEVSGWFKDPSLEELGRKYWKKRTYIFQGFVTDDGLNESTKPENPIRRFVITPQIYQLISSALVDPELEESPTDYVMGIDFKIVKTLKGGYNDYSTSKWSRRERPLNDQELAAIEQYGLFNLADFLPKKPTDIELKVIKEMFEASVNGEPYDKDAWGQYYRPYGLSVDTQTSSTQEVAAAPAVDDDIPFDTTPTPTPVMVQKPTPTQSTTSNSVKAEDIMKMIRDRNKQ